MAAVVASPARLLRSPDRPAGSDIGALILTTDRALGGQEVEVEAVSDDGKKTAFKTHARVDNDTEVGYMHNGGVLPLVLRELISAG